MRAFARATLSLTLDTWLWLVNAQMLIIGALGQLVRRLSQSAPTPTP